MRRRDTDPEPAQAGRLRAGVRVRLRRAAARAALSLPLLALSGQAVILALPVASALAEQETLAEPPEPELPAAYVVSIEGVADGAIRSLLERSSQLIALADRLPATEAGLFRRIEGDFERFRTVLRSEGYYDSTIDFRFDDETTPRTIVVVIDTGPEYTLTRYEMRYVRPDADGDDVDGDEDGEDGREAEETAPEPPALSALGLSLGQRARAADIIGAERRAFARLANAAHPLAELVERDAVVDHRDRSMTVRADIDPGPFTRFGALTLVGLSSVREAYIRSLVPWREGEPYDQRKVNAFREKLVTAGVFTTVIIDRPAELAADGTLPITVTVIEGKQRSIGAGAKYYTSEGPAGEVFWEHRNLFGSNEDLRLTLEVGTIRQQATADVVVPDYRRPGQDLLGELQGTRQQTDAFDEIGALTAVRIRRPLTETWTGSLGTSLEWSRLSDTQDGTSSSTLLGLPAFLSRDTTKDRLDPRRGMRLRLDATPYAGWFDQPARFLVTVLGGSGYVPLDGEQRYVVAGRARIGSLVGQSRDDVPANKRFYGGGGDSIRGYQFQKVGPLDEDNDPLGGRSLLEVSAELRARVWGNFSLVPFIDAGNVYTPVVPDFSEQLRWAAGIGARYRTVIGPVRFDIAFPLNPRSDVDDTFQFYVSLGQAF